MKWPLIYCISVGSNLFWIFWTNCVKRRVLVNRDHILKLHMVIRIKQKMFTYVASKLEGSKGMVLHIRSGISRNEKERWRVCVNMRQTCTCILLAKNIKMLDLWCLLGVNPLWPIGSLVTHAFRMACTQQTTLWHACIDFLTYSDDHPSQ